jgi:excisionase family DNA binding protein
MLEKEFYTVKELAKLLSVNPMTIYRMVDRGELPVHFVGGRAKRFRRADIEAYLKKIRKAGSKSS